MNPLTIILKHFFSKTLPCLFILFVSFSLHAQTLVAHYPFDGNALDASGNENHGVADGPVLTTDRNGNPDGAYWFDGVDDMILFSNTQNFQPRFPLTVAVWVYLDGGEFQSVFANDYQDGIYYGIWLNISRNNVAINYGDGGIAVGAHRRSKIGTTILETHRWYHLAAIIRGPEDMSLFVNGMDDCGEYSGTGGALKHQGNNGRSGINQSSPTIRFNGKMDDLRLYEGELSREEIARLAEWGDYRLSEGLVAHYPFDGDAIDYSGNNHNGTLQNGAGYGLDRRDNPNGALTLDGTDDYIHIEANNNFKPQNPLSISCWVYLEDYHSNSIFRNDFQYGAYHGIYLIIQNGYPVPSFGNGTTTSPNGRRSFWGDTRLELNTWYHIAAIFKNTTSILESNSEILLFINGQFQCGEYEGTATSMVYSTGTDGDIGRGVVTPTEHYKGRIDELRLYNRALSSNEIKILAEESICYEVGCGEVISSIETPKKPHVFNIYPNPNDGIFNIEINDPRIVASKILVFNVNGQLVWKGDLQGSSKYRINLSHFSTGVYFLRLESEETVLTQKIVITK